MRFLIALAAIAAAASPLPATANAAAPMGDSSAAVAAPAKAKAKKICRDTGKKTGSRMGSGRKCHTAEEWAQIDSGGKALEVQSSQVGTISRTNR